MWIAYPWVFALGARVVELSLIIIQLMAALRPAEIATAAELFPSMPHALPVMERRYWMEWSALGVVEVD